jgi:Ariadne domain/Zn-finger in Ran binding protein and others
MNESPLISLDSATTAAILAEQDTDPNTMPVTYGTSRYESLTSKKRSTDMARFLHHYERWLGHAESATLEFQMAETVCKRLAPVVQQAIEYNGNNHVFGGEGLSFIHSAFSELLECRFMLQHSYAFAFFRYKSRHDIKYKLQRRQLNEKLRFEQFQAELELMTEQISDVVARTHIRATQNQITFLTAATAAKRKEFSNVMINILREEEKDDTRDNKKSEKHRKHRDSVSLDSTYGLVASMLPNSSQSRLGTASHSNQSSDDGSDGDAAADEALRESLTAFLANNAIGSNFRVNVTDDELHDWSCATCTYMNAGSDRRCEMCSTHR